MPNTSIAYSVFGHTSEGGELPSSQSTTPEYVTTGSTSSANVTGPAEPEDPAEATAGSDAEIDWLSSPEAQQYRGHWVALRAGTGTVLGLADSSEDVVRWQREGASIVFVVPSGTRIGG